MGYLRKGKWIRDEKFVSGRGVCVCESIGSPSILGLIRKTVSLTRMLPNRNLKFFVYFKFERVPGEDVGFF